MAEEDLLWIETMRARLSAGRRDARLEPFVQLSKLYALGLVRCFEGPFFETRIPALLYRHLTDPVECRRVAHVVGSLHATGHAAVRVGAVSSFYGNKDKIL